MNPKKEIKSQYGQLTVIKEVEPSLKIGEKKYRAVLCKCSCGEKKILRVSNLQKGNTNSCGCLRKTGNHSRTHGKTKTTEHYAWLAMRKRCLLPNHKAYNNYGGRGIKICKEWINSFEQFYKDMGPKPKGYSLERIDNNGNYCKENCVWADMSTQNQNRRATVLTPDLVNYIRAEKSKGKTYKAISTELDLNYETVRNAGNGKTWKNIT